jgi:hypothetical protein
MDAIRYPVKKIIKVHAKTVSNLTSKKEDYIKVYQ